MKTIEQLLWEMLTESTGEHMLDSGGAYGRHWQRNQAEFGNSLDSLWRTSPLTIDADNAETSADVIVSVSVFHYLRQVLELDDVCQEFNELECKEWDGDTYGISKEQQRWLEDQGFSFGNEWNTYNGESWLTQTLQGTNLKKDGCGEGDYMLLQIHQGCDVRGGYTNAKLVKLTNFQEFLNPVPYVSGTITTDGENYEVSNSYDGYSLTEETTGEHVPVNKNSDYQLELCV